LRGRAVYAIGGLLEPGNFGEAAREPVTPKITDEDFEKLTRGPLVPAGCASGFPFTWGPFA
jgi:hypothetical protein